MDMDFATWEWNLRLDFILTQQAKAITFSTLLKSQCMSETLRCCEMRLKCLLIEIRFAGVEESERNGPSDELLW
jgi:hypothetical protein